MGASIRNMPKVDIILMALSLILIVLASLVGLKALILSKRLTDLEYQMTVLNTQLADYGLQITELDELTPIPTPKIEGDVRPLGSLTVMPGDQRITFLYFMVATEEDPELVHISAVEIVRDGDSTDGDITNIRLYEGYSKHQIGPTKELDSSTHSATFSGFDAMISPYSIKVFTVEADISPTAAIGNSVRLSVSSIEKTGKQNLYLPYRGQYILIGNSSLPTPVPNLIYRLQSSPEPFSFGEICAKI